MQLPSNDNYRRTVRASGVPTVRWAARVRRLSVLVLAGGLLWFLLCFRYTTVPPGPATLNDIQPGAACLLDRRAGALRPGCAVFVEMPGGGVMLSRLQEVEADGDLVIRHDRDVGLPDSRTLGAFPASSLVGVVLVVFASDDDARRPPDLDAGRQPR